MPQVSAGLLMYRMQPKLELFLVHPGGPFFKNKDEGAWTIPKGQVEENEQLLEAAKREFKEETGLKPGDTVSPLHPIKTKRGKTIHAWAFEGQWDGSPIKSNFFSLEWPHKSGKFSKFLEVDRAGWFSLEEAKIKINKAQQPFISQLQSILKK